MSPSISPSYQSGLGNDLLLEFSISTDFLHFPTEFFQAISTLFSYTLLIDSLDNGIVPKPTAFELIFRRNAVQHALLSLPAAAELAHLDETETHLEANMYLYESLRLGSLLFSIALVFPVPVTDWMIRNVVWQLRSAILAFKYTNNGKGWAGKERMCLWLCVLGGVASKEVPEERLLLIDMVRELSVVLGLKSWEEVIGVIDRYLWMNRACDEGGRQFWCEVVG